MNNKLLNNPRHFPIDVAVVVPIREQTNRIYLDRCFHSILFSTLAYKVRVHLVVVLDGSSRETEKLVARSLREVNNWCSTIPRYSTCEILPPSQVNKGIAATLNRGYDHALLNGAKYLTWLGCDDWYTPDGLLALRELLGMNGGGMVIGDYHPVNGEGDRIEGHKTPTQNTLLGSYQAATPQDILSTRLNLMMCSADILAKFRPDPRMEGAEDLDFTLRVALGTQMGTVVYSGVTAFNYTVAAPGSYTGTKSPKILSSVSRCFWQNVMPNQHLFDLDLHVLSWRDVFDEKLASRYTAPHDGGRDAVIVRFPHAAVVSDLFQAPTFVQAYIQAKGSP